MPLSRISIKTIVITSLWIVTALLHAEESHTIQEETIYPSTTLRLQSFAQKSEVIRNPAQWTQIDYVAPEGSRVETGDPLFHFDMRVSLGNLRKAQENAEIKRLEYTNEVSGIEENLLQLRNNIEEAHDTLKVLEARLKHQRTLPLEDDVRIAQGRMTVALKNAEAEDREIARSRERFKRDMISSRALKKAEIKQAKTAVLLAYAKETYKYAKLPASTNTLRILELKIENAKLQSKQLEEEYRKREEIADIKKNASLAESALRQQRVDDLIEDTSQSEILAQRAGTVLYSSRFKRALMSGDKTRKNEALIEFPDPKSLAFQGFLPDHLQTFFKKGDPVEIRLNPDRSTVIAGYIKTIKPLPRDLAETKSKHWGQKEQNSGIKVYDVIIDVDETLREQLAVGIYGQANLAATSPWSGPTAPLSYVKTTPEGFFLAYEGAYHPVEGRIIAGKILLEDRTWIGRKIANKGSFQENNTPSSLLTTDRLVSSGELTPLNPLAVRVPKIRMWDLKIKWIAPEYTDLSEGDKLIEFTSENLEKELNDFETRLTSARSKRQSYEERLTIQQRNSEFRLKRENNVLEIRKLEKYIVDNSLNYNTYLDRQLALQQAQIELDRLREESAWAKKRPSNFSPAEFERMQRDLTRQTLKFELATIRLEQIKKGSDPLTRAKAERDLIIQTAKVEELNHDIGNSNYSAKRHLNWRKSQEQHREKLLRQRKEYQENLIATAPKSGLLTYEKVWDGLGVSKIKEGLGVWQGTHIISIANTERMFVRIPVAEQYFTHIKKEMPVEVLIPAISQDRYPGRIMDIEFMLARKDQGNTAVGLYGSHEPSGAQVFYIHVTLDNASKIDLKAGAAAHVIFPFAR